MSTIINQRADILPAPASGSGLVKLGVVASTPAQVSAQTKANRAAAVAKVRASLGLNDVPSSWTYDQRTTYNKALATYIQANPEYFDESALVTAEIVAKKEYTALEDASFDWADFAAETARPVTDLGEGVASTFSLSKWLLPLAAVSAVLILLAALANRTGARRA